MVDGSERSRRHLRLHPKCPSVRMARRLLSFRRFQPAFKRGRSQARDVICLSFTILEHGCADAGVNRPVTLVGADSGLAPPMRPACSQGASGCCWTRPPRKDLYYIRSSSKFWAGVPPDGMGLTIQLYVIFPMV